MPTSLTLNPYFLLDFGAKKLTENNKIRQKSAKITTAAFTETTLNTNPVFSLETWIIKAASQTSLCLQRPSPPLLRSLTCGTFYQRVKSLLLLLLASAYTTTCPLQRAAGSRAGRLQHLYASVPKDTAPFSPIEPLSAAGNWSEALTSHTSPFTGYML